MYIRSEILILHTFLLIHVFRTFFIPYMNSILGYQVFFPLLSLPFYYERWQLIQLYLGRKKNLIPIYWSYFKSIMLAYQSKRMQCLMDLEMITNNNFFTSWSKYCSYSITKRVSMKISYWNSLLEVYNSLEKIHPDLT